MKINLLFITLQLMVSLKSIAQVYDLDLTFNSIGKAIVDINSGFDGAYNIQVSQNDEVFIFGYSNDVNGKSSMVLSKFMANGNLDINFGTSGKFIFNENSTIGKAMILLSSGKILIAGKMNLNGDAVWNFIRLNANGSIDNTWDGDGMAIIDAGGFFDEPSKLIELPNGKILAIGSGSQNGSGKDFSMVKLNSNGSKDFVFGIDGLTHLNVKGGFDEAIDAVVLNDGKIIVCGTATDGLGKSNMTLAKFSSNGSIDNTFGTGGFVLLENSEIGFSQANSLIVEGNNIYTTGFVSLTSDPGSFISFIAKYDLNGNIITSFGVNGLKFLDNNSIGNKIIRHFNGSFIIAGSTNFDASLVNIDADGNFIQTFGDFGKIVINNSTALDELNDIVEKGNKIYALGTGFVRNLNDTDMFVLKFIDPLNTDTDELISTPFKIYPNPCSAESILTIETEFLHNEVTLTDMFGRKHFVSILDKTIVLPKNITNGIYLLTISNQRHNISKTIIVK